MSLSIFMWKNGPAQLLCFFELLSLFQYKNRLLFWFFKGYFTSNNLQISGKKGFCLYKQTSGKEEYTVLKCLNVVAIHFTSGLRSCTVLYYNVHLNHPQVTTFARVCRCLHSCLCFLFLSEWTAVNFSAEYKKDLHSMNEVSGNSCL